MLLSMNEQRITSACCMGDEIPYKFKEKQKREEEKGRKREKDGEEKKIFCGW
jgi:hypothetical protein